MLIERNSTVASNEAARGRVQRSVVLPAPVEEVWASLTEADRLDTWFGAEVEIDARRGGHATFRWPEGIERGAVLEDVERERFLSFRWLPFLTIEGRRAIAPPGRVEVTLAPTDEGTTLSVTEWTSGAGMAP